MKLAILAILVLWRVGDKLFLALEFSDMSKIACNVRRVQIYLPSAKNPPGLIHYLRRIETSLFGSLSTVRFNLPFNFFLQWSACHRYVPVQRIHQSIPHHLNYPVHQQQRRQLEQLLLLAQMKRAIRKNLNWKTEVQIQVSPALWMLPVLVLPLQAVCKPLLAVKPMMMVTPLTHQKMILRKITAVHKETKMKP